MLWNHDEDNGGFSSQEPWPPVPETHWALAVSSQTGDENSLLEHYRRLLQFRRDCRPLIKGSLQSIEVRDDV